VEEERANTFREIGLSSCIFKKNGKIFIDLKSANLHQALKIGVPEKNIMINNTCTICSDGRFFSYRREGERVLRQLSFILLR